jgi:GDP/UDP-N,N'-diacetylbacillosamine 2-epimerase (hydrolysing)
MKRKICIVTGTRAEYGLLKWLMFGIKNDPDLQLQIIVTGMHLSPEFGLTFHEIENDGFSINQKIEMLLSSDSGVGIAKSMGLGMIGFADAFHRLQPDIVVLLGDRFEMLSAASTALALRIPLAHIHGGEATEGLIDEAIRHSITKMAHLHFVAAQEYRDRVIQLGESPDRVYLAGALGVDGIMRTDLMGRQELEDALKFKFRPKNLLITFHPVTLEAGTSKGQTLELLSALAELKDTGLIFTLPNADADGRVIIDAIQEFIASNENACGFSSLGHTKYLSCVSLVDGVVGNSSSGLIEVPSFKKGAINIGDRQRGRLQSASVINCEPNKADISRALNKLYDENFLITLKDVVNVYGGGNASEVILSALKSVSIENILKKRFNDWPSL